MIANLYDPLEVGMTAKSPNKPKADNPYIEAAQRIRQLAQILAQNPNEAKAFRAEIGMFTAKGALKAKYR
ncbi:hypothetical protein ACQKPE_05145 [Pseudomonas sp. NPDC089554]|uniref:hypothetical protein n=1 Tax=Pseudomonas sp. NPDC089554 TaxID=3390653 RepID=UPI003D0833F7